jgi:chromosome segregation ATPase
MRAAIISIAVIIALTSIALAYYQNIKADGAVGELNQERYLRMVAEESLQKSEAAVAKLSGELEAVKAQLANSEKLLKQAQATGRDLQERLNEAEAMKATFESRLKSAAEAQQPAPIPATGDL